ncbi:MAG: DNA internalization-related competence protein ComEC/Rec2 [Desulfuromonadales bacterium]|nr:DNA internalization-related competence protein ComEC/Rec2 [Desulfuromonadales bacterium]
MTPYWLLAALAAGIVLARLSPGELPPNLVWPASALLTCLWLPARRSVWAWLPLLAGVTFCGLLLANKALVPPDDPAHISRFVSEQPTIIEGRIVSLEDDAVQGQRVILQVLTVIDARFKATPCRGRLRLGVGEGALTAQPGQVVRFRGRLRLPSRFGTPGEFDYPLYLASRGIYATGFVKQAGQVLVLPEHAGTRASFWENLRGRLARQIDQSVAAEQAPLVKALTVGMRAGINDEQRSVLSAAGVAHLFAISGLHFGLLGILLYTVGSWLYRRSTWLALRLPARRILPILLIAPLAGYLCLTGDSWSTQRAFTMAAIGALLLFGRRRTPPLALLATTALLVLLGAPLALFQPGFQLSFAGLAGILAWGPFWQPRLSALPILWRWPLTILLTTTAATLATAPFLLWHFHAIAPAALPANLLAIPLIAWGAVPACLAGALLHALAPGVAALAFQSAGLIIDLTLAGVGAISRLPGLGPLDLPLTRADMAALGTLLAVMLWQGKHRGFAWGRLLLPVLVFLAMPTDRPAADALQITALSVGQGDATLISLPEDRHFLVDGGGLPGARFDPGERLIVPALGRLGIRRLDGVILSHDHPDHRDGLLALLEHIRVDTVWAAMARDRLHPPLRQAIEDNGVHYRQLPAGWLTLIDQPDHLLRLFTPQQAGGDLNEQSVIVLVGDQHNRALLTADLGPPGLRQLAATWDEPPVSLLKVPHHGSRRSQTDLFLDLLQSDIAFISSGRGNPYGFPHQETLNALTARQIPVYRTDRDGSLFFISRPEGWKASTTLAANGSRRESLIQID